MRFWTSDAGAADALADRLAGEPELVDEQGAGARLLDRVQVLAGHVLDQGQLERLAVLVRGDDGGDELEAGELGGAPPALPGDQLVGAARARTDQHRLDDAALTHRLGGGRAAPLGRSFWRGWRGFGAIRSTGSRRSSGAASLPSTGIVGVRIAARPAAHPAVAVQHGAATSLASSKYASNQAQSGS